MEKEWPEGKYTVVKLETGNIKKMNAVCDNAALIDPKEQYVKGLSKQRAEKYPKSMELIKDGDTVGQIENNQNLLRSGGPSGIVGVGSAHPITYAVIIKAYV